MPSGESVTPAEQRRRGGLAVFLLFLLIVILGLCAIILSVHDGRNLRLLATRFHLEAYLSPKLSRKAIEVAPRTRRIREARYPIILLASPILPLGRLQAGTTLSAEDRCRAIRPPEGDPPQFTPTASDWECTLYRHFGDNDDAASIFIQAKGTDADGLQTFRIKLSFTDPPRDSDVLTAALAALHAYPLDLSASENAYIEAHLEGRLPFRSYLENYDMTLMKEMTDPRRYNLLLITRPDKTACPVAPPPSDVRLPDEPRAIAGRPIGCFGFEALRPRLER